MVKKVDCILVFKTLKKLFRKRRRCLVFESYLGLFYFAATGGNPNDILKNLKNLKREKAKF